MESFKPIIKTNKEYEQEIYNMYLNELKEAKKKKYFPLYLYSKRVYRAYKNAWRLIDRKLLTNEEVNIMLKLGIYKPSQKDIGIRNLHKEICKEFSKIRIGIS